MPSPTGMTILTKAMPWLTETLLARLAKILVESRARSTLRTEPHRICCLFSGMLGEIVHMYTCLGAGRRADIYFSWNCRQIYGSHSPLAPKLEDSYSVVLFSFLLFTVFTLSTIQHIMSLIYDLIHTLDLSSYGWASLYHYQNFQGSAIPLAHYRQAIRPSHT